MTSNLKKALFLSSIMFSTLFIADLRAESPNFVSAQKISILLKDKEAPFIGDKEGQIIGAVFVDALCGHCKTFKSSLIEVLPKFKNVRFNILEYPIFGETSELIGRASIAAANQGAEKYQKFIEAMSHVGSTITLGQIKGTASALKMDSDKLEHDMYSKEVTAKMGQYINIGRSMNVEGTPYVIIGDETFAGALPATILEEKIHSALNKS